MAHDQDVDFQDLSPEDTLDLAIEVEVEARQRYLEFVDQMTLHHTEEAAEFFRRMADLEANHAGRLRDVRTARFGSPPVAADPPLPVVEVEAPEYEHVRAFMSVHDALDVALESEQKAYRFYDEALGRVDDEDVRALFEALRSQEERHQQLIESFRETLPEERDVDPDDYVDEPRAL
jgi:rubrerythrin